MGRNWEPTPIAITDQQMTEINQDPDAEWWVTHTSPPNIIPAQDILPHKFGPNCPCQPVDDGEVVSHNAFDKRELYEDGQRKPH